MYSSMISSANTMGQIQQQMDGISNNLANTNRTGYKRREASFSELLFQQMNNNTAPNTEAGRLTPLGLRSGAGAAIAQTALRLEHGSLQETGRDLDFALTEKGYFFQVESMNNQGEAETQYTRDGSFYLTENPDNPDTWTLVNNEGDYLLNNDGERMNVPGTASNFQLADDGTLTAEVDGEEAEIGQIELARATKPQLLEAVGGSNFRLPDLEALDLEEADVIEFVAGENSRIIQGSLEQSNVDLSKEMTDLTTAQRSYSFNSRALSQGDQMMGLINSIRG
ncbi:flagellar hook-basal body protein [Alteribacillus sp. HJP-4]|uniref:flagellar hook-basal body protein n=1 Tax=Alteribacillus sp. HJP-4 TaxID=2775394 RepID=UPI0035CD1803